MKACAACYRLFPDDAGFCPIDGGALAPYAEVPHQPKGDDPFLGSTLCERYEIRRIVADGGMGRVYEARDAHTDRRVAAKVLHPEIARDPVAVERFRREFEISKDLPHDHIVEVLDFQQVNERQSIMVMEFLDGEELRTILKRDKSLAPARLLRVMSQVAIELDEAHRREFVHRDLKPDNIFLCGSQDGDVAKLLDFGSARMNKNRQMSKLTSLGTTIGSPFYMSPEQAQGSENLDHRADVFALGAISYECLTGSVPFSGSNGPAILLAILTKNPPPVTTKANPEWHVPSAVDDVIDDALAKKPETRTPTVGAFAEALCKAFGLTQGHEAVARMKTTDIARAIEEAHASGTTAGPTSVADPFAADPFARPAPAVGQPPMPAASAMQAAPPPRQAPSQAMDEAFAAAGAGAIEQAAGVPQRPIGLLIAIAVAICAIIATVVVLATR